MILIIVYQQECEDINKNSECATSCLIEHGKEVSRNVSTSHICCNMHILLLGSLLILEEELAMYLLYGKYFYLHFLHIIGFRKGKNDEKKNLVSKNEK